MDTENKLPDGFENPTSLPTDHDAQKRWQDQNRDWWEKNPMRYDWNEEIGGTEREREFFTEIDRRHFSDAAKYTPPQSKPFDELIPYDSLKNADVLEIGVGNGSHAQLLAPHCRSYTGIDLTDYAITSTRRRFQLGGLQGDIRRMDAENLEFPDGSFDFIWTWGVIHHSANTEKILREMNRVLRPGGRAVVMVYHRSFLYYYIFNGFFRGVLAGGFLKTPSLHRLVQLSTDGAIARFYSIEEWTKLVSPYFKVSKVLIKGQKSEIIPLPAGRIKNGITKIVPDSLARLVLNSGKQGSFVITQLEKI
jgi:ubiquinone/menaquinone biosynthesis C-methylase UbiE